MFGCLLGTTRKNAVFWSGCKELQKMQLSGITLKICNSLQQMTLKNKCPLIKINILTYDSDQQHLVFV